MHYSAPFTTYDVDKAGIGKSENFAPPPNNKSQGEFTQGTQIFNIHYRATRNQSVKRVFITLYST